MWRVLRVVCYAVLCVVCSVVRIVCYVFCGCVLCVVSLLFV